MFLKASSQCFHIDDDDDKEEDKDEDDDSKSPDLASLMK